MRPLNGEIIAQMADKLKTDPRLVGKNQPAMAAKTAG
jgi:hypothetical protein